MYASYSEDYHTSMVEALEHSMIGPDFHLQLDKLHVHGMQVILHTQLRPLLIVFRSHLNTGDTLLSSPRKSRNKVFLPAAEDIAAYVAAPPPSAPGHSYISPPAGPRPSTHIRPALSFQEGSSDSIQSMDSYTNSYTSPLASPRPSTHIRPDLSFQEGSSDGIQSMDFYHSSLLPGPAGPSGFSGVDFSHPGFPSFTGLDVTDTTDSYYYDF